VKSRTVLSLGVAVVLLAGSCGGSADRESTPTTSTATSPTPSAPPECVEAWRAGRYAPVHCEEYPDAYRAILEELGRD
jgi:hypothetical protein